MKYIATEKLLRKLYEAPLKTSLKKQKPELDEPSIEFINNSPFLLLATTSPNASTDCSPKGDGAGFVKILSKKLIAIPDRRGNNRLDSLVNIINEPKIGIIFLIPGKNETLRVNGRAKITNDEKLLSELAHDGKNPTVAIIVEVDEVYFHCPKALIRANLWNKEVTPKNLESYVDSMAKQLGESLSLDEILNRSNQYKATLKDRLY